MSPALVKAAIDAFSVLKTGSTMSGELILSSDPTNSLGAATKQYVYMLGVKQYRYSLSTADYITFLTDENNCFYLDTTNKTITIPSCKMIVWNGTVKANINVYAC